MSMEDITASGVAICICTRNRPDELRRALESIGRSTVAPSFVLVSDDSDAQVAGATREVCTSFTGVKYTEAPHRGLSANRNHCLLQLPDVAQFVLFLDDDALLSTDFLSVGLTEANATPRTIVTGWESRNGIRIEPHNLSFWGFQEISPRGAADTHAININATLFSRDLFHIVCFDEKLRFGSEEVDICGEAERAGFSIRYCPGMGNYHLPAATNREEYARVIDASRLYATYKRYRWVQRRPLTAFAFAVAAPVHLIGSMVKGGRFNRLRPALRSIALAAAYVHEEGETRKSRSARTRPPLGFHLRD
jgi:GT2 family glycosyltransferase